MSEDVERVGANIKKNGIEPEQQMVYERFDVSILHTMALHHFHRYLAVLPLCKGKDVLDIACGTGYGSALLAQTAHAVTGVDIDRETVEACQANYCPQCGNLTFLQGDVAKIPLPDASVDVLVSFETIEHVDASTQGKFMREIRRVLRPGGVLAMSSPNKDTAHSNEFHIHELEEDEFRSLLKSQFKHSVYFRQKIVLSSFICPYGGKDVARAALYGILARDGHPTEPCKPNVDAKYVIAIASDRKVPALSASVNLDASGAILDAFARQNAIRSTSALRKTIEELRSAACMTRQRLIALNERETQLREEVAKRKMREESLRDGIAKHSARAAALRETVDACKATEARLRAALEAGKGREATLRDGIAKHSAHAAALRKTLDACKASEARLRAALEAGKKRESSLRETIEACRATEAGLRSEIELRKRHEGDLSDGLVEERVRVSALQKRIVSFRPYSFSPEERRHLRCLAILHPIRCRRLLAEMRLIASSPLFDVEYYCRNNAEAGKTPLLHFCQKGWREGCNPSALFDINDYLNNDQTCDPRENPLAHFLQGDGKDMEIHG